MGRFLFWTLVFSILGGIVLHMQWNIPFVSIYLGLLPGDMHIKKGDLIIFFPLTSAILMGIVASVISAVFTSKK